jgi:hypothetical protein
MRGSARRTTRLGAYAASGALALTGTLLAVTPSQAAPDLGPSNQAATWLAGELENDGGMFSGDFSQGLSIDAALALDVLGNQPSAIQGVSDTLEPEVGDYISFAGTFYAGSAAKAAVLAQLPDADAEVTNYGGFDLPQIIEDKAADSGPITGRIPDTNVIGQAFAFRALDAFGSDEADTVRAFLLKQQCSSGYFRLSYSTSDTSPNQSCVNGTDAPDADATSIAVLQLQARLVANPELAGPIDKAKAWLRGQQRCDGSFGGGTGTTGLAAWVLEGTPAARQAAQWLRARQATQGTEPDALAGETGALAYDDAALAEGRLSGISDDKRDQWRRATAQAGPGLRDLDLTSPTPAIALTGPTAFVKASSRQVLSTSGADAGTVLCVTGPGASVRGIAGSTALKSTVTVPAGTATRVYTAKDVYGSSDTHALKVLGVKRLPVVRSAYKVKRGRYVTAMITGLVPNEWSRIVYKGILVRSGKASATGKFAASFRVGRAKGVKSIVGYGHFTDIRRGATTIKVVR